MNVICKTVDASTLHSSFHTMAYGSQTKFDLKLGELYMVYAQCIYKGGLHYLINSPGINGPDWYPADLFTVANPHLPTCWIFSYETEFAEVGVSAIWGYPELINDPEHFDGLSERRRQDVELFSRRKRQIDFEMTENR